VNPIQKLMLSMFIHMRIGVGVIGLSLPLVLFAGGKLLFHVNFAGSMSAYYHATTTCTIPQCPNVKCVNQQYKDDSCEPGKGPMRNWFVGNLFFIGAAMFFLKGFSQWENWALNTAGIAAPCVALFPMDWPCRTCGLNIHSVHFPAALTFFICAGFTCVFCSEKTLNQIPKNDPKYKKVGLFRLIYRTLGIAMFVLPACAWAFAYKTYHVGFWLETAGVCAFGAYWLVKTVELEWSEVEKKALFGVIKMNPHTLLR
jgi:hypothetical protein